MKEEQRNVSLVIISIKLFFTNRWSDQSRQRENYPVIKKNVYCGSLRVKHRKNVVS